MEFSETTLLKTKVFYFDGKQSITDSVMFEQSKYLEPVTNLRWLVNGLTYEYYEGEWNQLPDFEELSPFVVDTCSSVTINKARQADHYALVFHGYLNIIEEGKYKFYIKSDDGSKLYIGDKCIVNNDFNHAAVEKNSSVFLKKGMHAFRIEYFENTGGQVLELKYEAEGLEKQLIHSSNLYRKE